MKPIAFGWLLVVAAAVPSTATSQDKVEKSLVGKPAPEIIAADGHWLGNSGPQALARLKGKVVWLHFNF